MQKRIISSAKKRMLFLPHAIEQMSRPDRMISTIDVRDAIVHGEIIEDYPEDKRGVSCLVSYMKQDRTLHVVCAPKPEYLAIITAYWPTKGQWSSDFKVRK